MKKARMKLMNRGNSIAIVASTAGEIRCLNIEEAISWSGEPRIQVSEAGTGDPWATISRSIVSSEKGLTRFVANISEEDIGILRQLVGQGVITLHGEMGEIKWPNKEKIWEELIQELGGGDFDGDGPYNEDGSLLIIK